MSKRIITDKQNLRDGQKKHEGTGDRHQTLGQYMEARLEELPPFEHEVTVWDGISAGERSPCYIAFDQESGDTLFEAEIPIHRVATNIKITDLSELAISTPTLHGEEAKFAGYGISPNNGTFRTQRELMPDGVSGRVIQVELPDGSLGIVINLPAKGIAKTNEDGTPEIYGHPDQDGAAIRPFQIIQKEGAKIPPETTNWDEKLGFSSVLADGNTSKEVSRIRMRRLEAVVMGQLKGNTYQILGKPEPWTELALAHVGELGQVTYNNTLALNVAVRLEQMKMETREKIRPESLGGTTAAMSLHLLPSENDHQLLYRTMCFEPPAGRDKKTGRPKTNLGHSLLLTRESDDVFIKPTKLTPVTVTDPITGKRNHQRINSDGAEPGMLTQNWMQLVNTNDATEFNQPGIRIETSDGVLGIKDPNLLFEGLTEEMTPEEAVAKLSSTEFLENTLELHPYDDVTLVITIPSQLREGDFTPPVREMTDDELKAAITIPGIDDETAKTREIIPPPVVRTIDGDEKEADGDAEETDEDKTEREPADEQMTRDEKPQEEQIPDQTPEPSEESESEITLTGEETALDVIELVSTEHAPAFVAETSRIADLYEDGRAIAEATLPQALVDIDGVAAEIDEHLGALRASRLEFLEESDQFEASYDEAFGASEQEIQDIQAEFGSIDSKLGEGEIAKIRSEINGRFQAALAAQNALLDERARLQRRVTDTDKTIKDAETSLQDLRKLREGVDKTSRPLFAASSEEHQRKVLDAYTEDYDMYLTLEAIQLLDPDDTELPHGPALPFVRFLIDPDGIQLSASDFSRITENTWQHVIDILELLQHQSLVTDVDNEQHQLVIDAGKMMTGLPKSIRKAKKGNVTNIVTGASLFLKSISKNLITIEDEQVAPVMNLLNQALKELGPLPTADLTYLEKSINKANLVLKQFYGEGEE